MTSNKAQPSFSQRRHQSRYLAVQALYQAEISGQPIVVALEDFLAHHDVAGSDPKYFQQLLNGVAQHRSTLEEAIQPHCDRPLKDLTPIEHMILLQAVYELSHEKELPCRVVINEACELAKIFGAQDSYKFINGVLDHFSQSIGRL